MKNLLYKKYNLPNSNVIKYNEVIKYDQACDNHGEVTVYNSMVIIRKFLSYNTVSILKC